MLFWEVVKNSISGGVETGVDWFKDKVESDLEKEGFTLMDFLQVIKGEAEDKKE